MRNLFGEAANVPISVASAGLGFATLFAVLPFIAILALTFDAAENHGADFFYTAIFDPRNLQAFENSIFVGLIVAPSAIGIAVIGSIILYYLGATADRVIYVLAAVPLFIPDYILGIAGTALIQPQFGVFGHLFPDTLLVDRMSALLVVAGATLFKWTPAMIVMADAQIALISPEVLRQACLDFERSHTLIRFVLFPRIARVIPLIGIFCFLIAFRQQELANELTGGAGGFRAETWPNWNYRVIYEFFDPASAAGSSLIVLAFLSLLVEAIRRLGTARAKGRQG